MHSHTIRGKHGRRWFLNWGPNLNWGISAELSWRWRGGFHMTCGYGGQEDFAEATLAIPRCFFLHFAFDTPFRWKRLRPFDGKYSESEATFGLYQVAGTLYLLVGRDKMGTYYSTHGRFGSFGRWLQDIKRNREITLFRGDWILGRAQHSLDVLEADIPVVVNVGQWDGDIYHGTAQHTRRTWKRRFSTKVSDGYEITMQQGIPFPGKGENSWDCGDDAYYGFGGATIESAVNRIVADVIKRRGPHWRPEDIRVREFPR